MNCTAFEKRLDQYQAGRLSEADRREVDQHAYRCPACKALLEALQLSDSDGDWGRSDFSQAVLARTSGSACKRCRTSLGDFLDGILEGLDNELIGSHLGSCSSCSELCRVMAELKETLPQMSEMPPDSAFAREVVNLTRRPRPESNGLISRILTFFEGLLERPRFSWEAAYLGTLLVFALFGTPFSPVHDAGSRLLASLQEREGLFAQAGSSLRKCYANAELTFEASHRARQTLSRISAESLEMAEEVMKRGRLRLSETERYLTAAGTTIHSKFASTFQKAGPSAQHRKQ